MRCFICNVRCDSDVCPKCAAEREWKLNPVQPKPAPIPEFHDVVVNNSMALAMRKVLGRRAKV